MRWGDHLEFSGEAGPAISSMFRHTCRQEINALADEPCEAVVVRRGQESIVINLEIESRAHQRRSRRTPFHLKAKMVTLPISRITGRRKRRRAASRN
jgi:hypothetical protein